MEHGLLNDSILRCLNPEMSDRCSYYLIETEKEVDAGMKQADGSTLRGLLKSSDRNKVMPILNRIKLIGTGTNATKGL